MSMFRLSALQPCAKATTPSGLRIRLVKVLYLNQSSHVTFNSKNENYGHVTLATTFRKSYSLTVVLDIGFSSLAVGFRLAYAIQLTSLYCCILASLPQTNNEISRSICYSLLLAKSRQYRDANISDRPVAYRYSWTVMPFEICETRGVKTFFFVNS